MTDDTHQDDGQEEEKDQEQVPVEAGDMDELKQKIADAQAKEEGSVHNTYQEEIEKLKAEKIEAEAQMKRVVADFQNSKRRLEEEKTQFAAFASQKVMMQVIDIYENYERLLAHEPEGLDEEWKKGFELIYQQFQKLMESQGVVKVEVKIGEQIDPEKHQAMMSEEGPQGEILEVYSHAYEMNGRILKSAMVKVGKVEGAGQ